MQNKPWLLRRSYPYLGMVGSVIGYALIAIALAASSWFSWFNNALSDLGNTSVHPNTAWIFDSGLVIAGLLSTIFSALLMWENRSWKYLLWSLPLTLAAMDLILIGIFNESFGAIHGIVSVIFFFMIALSLFLFSYVSFPLGMPRLGAVALIFGIISSAVWIAHFPWKGIAIQEASTSALAAIFIFLIAWKMARKGRAESGLKP
jgi:hypothetical membrane protein